MENKKTCCAKDSPINLFPIKEQLKNKKCVKCKVASLLIGKFFANFFSTLAFGGSFGVFYFADILKLPKYQFEVFGTIISGYYFCCFFGLMLFIIGGYGIASYIYDLIWEYRCKKVKKGKSYIAVNEENKKHRYNYIIPIWSFLSLLAIIILGILFLVYYIPTYNPWTVTHGRYGPVILSDYNEGPSLNIFWRTKKETPSIMCLITDNTNLKFNLVGDLDTLPDCKSLEYDYVVIGSRISTDSKIENIKNNPELKAACLESNIDKILEYFSNKEADEKKKKEFLNINSDYYHVLNIPHNIISEAGKNDIHYKILGSRNNLKEDSNFYILKQYFTKYETKLLNLKPIDELPKNINSSMKITLGDYLTYTSCNELKLDRLYSAINPTPNEEANNFSVLSMSDMHNNIYFSKNENIIINNNEQIGERQIELYLSAGDNTWYGDSYECWGSLFKFTNFGHRLSTIPFISTIGNHDKDNCNSYIKYNDYKNKKKSVTPSKKKYIGKTYLPRLILQTSDSIGRSFENNYVEKDNVPFYTRTIYKTMQIFTLDSFAGDYNNITDEQLNWLKNELITSKENTEIKWRLLVVHTSPLSTGDVGNRTKMFNNLEPLLCSEDSTNNGCLDLVFSGHDHLFNFWNGKMKNGKTRSAFLVGGTSGGPLDRMFTNDYYDSECSRIWEINSSDKNSVNPLFLTGALPKTNKEKKELNSNLPCNKNGDLHVKSVIRFSHVILDVTNTDIVVNLIDSLTGELLFNHTISK